MSLGHGIERFRKRDKTVTIRVNNFTYTLLKKLSKRDHCSQADLIQVLLTNYSLEKNHTKDNKK